MKRFFSLLTALALLMGTWQPAFASSYSESGQIALTDSDTQKVKNYKVANLVMGGNDVISDIPAIIYDLNGKSRTLVPVRFITDNLGAQVAWNNDTKEATISLQDKVIQLKAGSADALVNGQPYTLPDKVPVKLMGVDYNYRTMVPIRFVSEQLGLEVNWIQATQTVTIDKPMQSITGIRYNGNAKHPEIIFKTTGEVEFASYFLKGSGAGGQDRIVIDMPSTRMDLTDSSLYDTGGNARLSVYAAGIFTVEGKRITNAGSQTRFSINVERKMGYDVKYVPETKEVRVSFNNTINQIDTEKLYNVETVVVRTAEEPAYNVKFQGNQVVVDFINAKLKLNGGVAGTVPVGKGGIQSVTYAPQSGGGEYEKDDVISRVTVNLDSGMRAEDVFIEHIDTDLYVYATGNPLDGFDYGRDSLDTSHLNVTFANPADYQLKYDKASRILDLTIPQNAIGLSPMDLDQDDSLVKKISITESGANYKVRIQLEKNTVYVDNSSGGNLSLVFVNDSLNNTTYQNKIVVLDAGHGGKDPGARSPYTGTQEKDLNLRIVQKLKHKLESVGYKVVTTRDDDTYIGLSNRAEVANSIGANAFLSIHFNSNTSAKPYGIEMLYAADAARDNYGFAQVLETEVCKTTGAYKRGVINRPELVVIRETKMAAVLAELGFLSNGAEEALVRDEAYQDKLVQGLFNAITKYVK